MKRLTIAMVGVVLVAGATVLAGRVEAAGNEAAWRPLFDGKTLSGWHAVGDGKWAVENGVIVGRANQEKLYGLLVSDKAFRDFTVRFKFKSLNGDSGFYIRANILPPEKSHGLQIQVGPLGTGTGGIYESYGRKWLPAKPTLEQEKSYLRLDDWNEVTIDAHGRDVVVRVNGVKSCELKDDPSPLEGHFAMQMHAGTVMEVMFKDIEILEGPSR